MDPKDILIQADQAVSDMRLRDALQLLDGYYSYRLRGGAEPRDVEPASAQNGDWFAGYCMTRVIVCVKQ